MIPFLIVVIGLLVLVSGVSLSILLKFIFTLNDALARL